MGRNVTARERAQAEEIATLVRELPLGASATEHLGAPLRRLFRANRAGAVGFGLRDERLTLDFIHGDVPPGFFTDMAAFVRSAPSGSTGFDPLRPAAHDRNHARFASRAFYRDRRHLPAFEQHLGRYPWLTREDFLRVLVCDGPVLLAWVGVMREEPYREGDPGVLQRIIPALRDRLVLERRLERAPVAIAGLAAAMEEIGAPAFVLSPAGVVQANTAGRLLLERAPRETRAALRAEVNGQGGGAWSVSRLAAPGLAAHHLLVRRAPPPDLALRLESFTARHGFTARQREVLALVVAGAANKTIAATLRVAVGTVELHVTAILARAGCESRAALVARFWSDC
jgi:DNA-binding NarL/FixJ family response regulator